MIHKIALTQTPMRIGLLGGGSDLPLFTESGNGPGCVISATIDKYVTVMARRRSDSQIIVDSLNFPGSEHVSEINALHNAYVRESLKQVCWQGGIEIRSMSDVAAGSGLGGSSAFLLGLLHALHDLQGSLVAAEEIAEEAFLLETGPLGKQIGRQDHWVAAFGGFQRYDFMPGGAVNKKNLGNLTWAEDQILMLNTGSIHASDNVFSDIHREENRERNIFFYGILADLARRGAFFAQRGCWEKFWALFEDAWLAKCSTSTMVSNAAIENLIATARAAGAQQVKICGTGGGGYLFCWCPEGRDVVLGRMTAGKRPVSLPFRFTRAGSRVIFYS